MPSIISATTTNGLVTSADNSGSLQLATNSGTTAVTIDTAQNVGVGTASISGRLTVSANNLSDGIVILGNDNANTKLRMTNSGSGGESWQIQVGQQGASNSNLVFYSATSSATRMLINSLGQLLVGATSTAFANDTSGGSFQGNQTGGGKPILEAINTNNTSSSDGCPAIIAAKGSSTTSSSARFIQFSAGTAATPMGGIVGNGASNVQFAAISDAREKTNIQQINGSLEKINSLKPVEFDWIADGSHVNAGFIAQDVKEIFPDFVVENMANEGQEQRYGLTGGMTGGIIPHLVKAIQELNAKVDAQAAEIQALKGVA